MSEHLTSHGVPHLVLEKNRIAEAWRSGPLGLSGGQRPGLARPVPEPGVRPVLIRKPLPAKERIADYFVEYAERFNAPIRTGVEVTKAERLERQRRVPGRYLGRSDRDAADRGCHRRLPASGDPASGAGRHRG